jgi:hypothetical protein
LRLLAENLDSLIQIPDSGLEDQDRIRTDPEPSTEKKQIRIGTKAGNISLDSETKIRNCVKSEKDVDVFSLCKMKSCRKM